ncbi:hypothetical protein PSAB6_10014 [Paraburkholderia sabiae]|nr:hypothetical protein PSAB6_10014 [Paraburkholderia sabiae]
MWFPKRLTERFQSIFLSVHGCPVSVLRILGERSVSHALPVSSAVPDAPCTRRISFDSGEAS